MNAGWRVPAGSRFAIGAAAGRGRLRGEIIFLRHRVCRISFDSIRLWTLRGQVTVAGSFGFFLGSYAAGCWGFRR